MLSIITMLSVSFIVLVLLGLISNLFASSDGELHLKYSSLNQDIASEFVVQSLQNEMPSLASGGRLAAVITKRYHVNGVFLHLIVSPDQCHDILKCQLICRASLMNDGKSYKYEWKPNCLNSTEHLKLRKVLHSLSRGSDREEKLNEYLGRGLDDFENFLDRHNKFYKTEEEHVKRYAVFRSNMEKASQLQRTEKGTAIYGANILADVTEEEYRLFYTNPKWTEDKTLTVDKANDFTIPPSFDWRQHGAVSPVKNQGSCGSCWAFSTTGNIEGQWAIHKSKLLSLSEQELVDCDKVDHGCSGGLPSNAYKEIIRLGGLETETKYPYDAANEKCKFSKSAVKAYINGSVAISKNETEIAQWLVQNGPISIGINANAMQWYMGGVAHPWKIFCNPSSLDHGVLIVGYGTKSGTPYWIIKNSWGPSWGVQGYYLVFRGGGVCGLNTMCTSAVVK